jgi:hypothetical protein
MEMRTIRKLRVMAIILAIASLGAAQLACSLFGGQAAAPPPDAAQPQMEVEPLEEQEQNAPEENGDSLEDQSEGPVEPRFGEDSLPCPAKGDSLMLGFDHALTVNYMETSITHFLHQGWLLLNVDDSGNIVSVAANPIPVSMEGRMSDECTLTGEGSMIPSAHGSCEAGVVSLIIEENWLPIQGEMVCIDDDGDVTRGPFNVPAMGMQTHSGANGTGENFYLVEGSEGYTSMRPFVEGEGYHSWTLYMEEIPIVPLVPDD